MEVKIKNKENNKKQPEVNKKYGCRLQCYALFLLTTTYL